MILSWHDSHFVQGTFPCDLLWCYWNVDCWLAGGMMWLAVSLDCYNVIKCDGNTCLHCSHTFLLKIADIVTGLKCCHWKGEVPHLCLAISTALLHFFSHKWGRKLIFHFLHATFFFSCTCSIVSVLPYMVDGTKMEAAITLTSKFLLLISQKLEQIKLIPFNTK